MPYQQYHSVYLKNLKSPNLLLESCFFMQVLAQFFCFEPFFSWFQTLFSYFLPSLNWYSSVCVYVSRISLELPFRCVLFTYPYKTESIGDTEEWKCFAVTVTAGEGSPIQNILPLMAAAALSFFSPRASSATAVIPERMR